VTTEPVCENGQHHAVGEESVHERDALPGGINGCDARHDPV
jgi:hypothetical protein